VAAVERLFGIRETLAGAGVSLAGGVTFPDWEPEHGLSAVRALLERERPSALICFNDRLALGAYQALADAGLRVPQDVSVVSFDDDDIASWIRPGLTTLALPHYELGRTAIDVLFDAIERRDASPADGGAIHRVAMPVRTRGSVAAPARM
jgi:LacI family transcriptional regulator